MDNLYDFTAYPDYLSQVFNKNNLSDYSNRDICEKLTAFCRYLLEQNQLFNLTAIKTPEAAALLHFADSLTLSEFLPKNAKILDIGSGAGFPAIPLAISRPDLTVTALDSTQKRIDFINRCAEMLDLANLKAVCHRAEDVTGKIFKDNFDIVTARAVASYPVLLELAIPAVKIGGQFVAMKSKDVSRETSGINKVTKLLGISEPVIHNIKIHNDDEEFERAIVVLNKVAQTPPKYPRPYAQIKKRPIF